MKDILEILQSYDYEAISNDTINSPEYLYALAESEKLQKELKTNLKGNQVRSFENLISAKKV